jgi:hypothetical protein
MDEKFAFCLQRVRYTTRSGSVKTYRVADVFKVGGPDDPLLGDPVYEKYFVLANSEREAMELGSAEMQKRGIKH